MPDTDEGKFLMRKFGSIFILLLCSVLVQAQQRSESDAVQVVREFLGQTGQTPLLSVVPHQKVDAQVGKNVTAVRKSTAQDKTAYYVVNDEANDRFVIVSADERMHTILGYSDRGTFDAGSVPPGLADMLYGYEQQYDYLLENADQSSSYKTNRAPVKAVAPLITTKWNQGQPYNTKCPQEQTSDTILNSCTGCVATAMAQVMNYYQYPAHGTGATSYVSNDITLSMDFSEVTFDWQNMADVYDKTSTEIQNDAVAELMYACGVAAHMKYSSEVSAAYTQDLAYAMKHFFNYNPNMKYYMRDYFSEEEWNAIIQDDLNNGRPIFYGGNNSKKEVGHQFILDGCDSAGRYHFNFGWSGFCDGYYELTALDTGDGYDFSYNQDMVCNVTPQTVGSHEDVFITDFEYDKSEVVVGDMATVSSLIHCSDADMNSYDSKFYGEIGFGVFDMNKNFVKSLYNCTIGDDSIVDFYKTLEIKASLRFDSSTFTEGSTYYIAPYAKSTNSEGYTWMRTYGGLDDYRIATVSNGVVTLGKATGPVYPASISTMYGHDMNGTVNIYGIDGVLKKTVSVTKGGDIKADLPRGLYIVNGKKMLLK